MSIQKQSPFRHKENFHLLPGRLRISITGLLNNQGLANTMAHRLAEFPGVKVSYANPFTGQVLLYFDPERTDLEPLLLWLSHAADEPTPERHPAPAPARAPKSIPREEGITSPAPAVASETISWHVFDAAEAIELLKSSATTGLDHHTAQERLLAFGPNELSGEPRPSFWQIALTSLNGFMTKLLFIAGGVSLLVGEITDAAVIVAIVGIQAVVEAAQSCRAEKSLENLRELSAPMATVLRGEEICKIPGSRLVPGDILHLEAGDMVPADAMIIEDINLTTNESCLTGESIPVVKDSGKKEDALIPVADQANMLFSGTSVTGGRATAMVVTTGMQTELGRIAQLLGDVRKKQSNLQKQLDYLGKSITQLVVISVGAIAAISLLRGRSIWEVLRTGISLAVGAVPEGLPAVLTVALSTGVQRMAKRNALVRNMAAVETLGSTTVICTDKTGTLTKNEMTVKELYIAHTLYTVAGEGYSPLGSIRCRETDIPESAFPTVAKTLEVAVLCNNAELRPGPGGKWKVLGDPTEGALLAAAAKAGLWWENLREKYCRHREIAFDAERRLMTVVCREPEGDYGIYVKGAPDAVANCCSTFAENSEAAAFDLRARNTTLAASEAMAEKALRVLAVAYKKLPAGTDLDQVDLESDLIFCGLIGMADSPRQGVQQAIRKCHAAGIKVVMITGDHQKTAEAVAAGLGILGQGKSITGRELDRITDSELSDLAEDITVYSRTTPDQKLRIVRALKGRGQIVAMTGDGVNDAPAIKEADIGIAMGRAGTDVTREVAGITLSDDNFATIVDGIEEGRTVSMNLSKSLSYILSGSMGQLVTMFTSTALGLPAPMLPAQILWVNLVTESLPAISFTADPPEEDYMKKPPLNPEGKLLFHQGGRILGRGALSGLAAFALYAAGLKWGGWSPAKARTMAFSQLVINRVFDLIARRKRGNTGKGPGSGENPLTLPAAALSASMLAATMYLPFMRPLFSTVPINLTDWIMLGANAFAASRIGLLTGPNTKQGPKPLNRGG